MALMIRARPVAAASNPARRVVFAVAKQSLGVTAAAAPESRAPAWSVSAASLLSAAAVFLAAAPPSLAAADLALGEQVFNGNCAACHMGGRNSVISEKTLDKAALEQYLEGGFKLEAIIYQVENGKGAMPAWADRLSEEEIQSVAAFVYKQASEALWRY
ncbi:hypothetical protein PLESTF_000044200 [Pleodorina starrii]|nr:hypothetical protein PLESTF_000044200 [Pleodorina starrii]